jgi:hypothetical protein
MTPLLTHAQELVCMLTWALAGARILGTKINTNVGV